MGLNALGFTNRSLRAQVSQLLGAPYTVNQMSYDLARLRSNGLIQRRPHTNTYQLTADGQRVAIFYTKVHNRLLRPLLAADRPPAPLELRAALTTIDRHLREYTKGPDCETPPENSRLVSVASDQRIASHAYPWDDPLPAIRCSLNLMVRVSRVCSDSSVPTLTFSCACLRVARRSRQGNAK